MFDLLRQHYLLFHTTAEGFAIIIAFCIFLLARGTYRFSRNNALLILGTGYFFVGLTDYLHLLMYKGMQLLPTPSANLPTQLWIAGRYVEALTFLVAVNAGQSGRNFRPAISVTSTFLVGASLFGALMASIWKGIFPDCYLEHVGLTAFKVASEYVICFMLLLAALQAKNVITSTKGKFKRLLVASMVCTILSELSFTLYTDVYGAMNAIGHVLKIVSYYLLYRGLVVEGLLQPYEVIFAELSEAATRDSLTGVLNHRGTWNILERNTKQAEAGRCQFGLLLLDIDRFKEVNDVYGHQTGDEVLKEFAALLQSNVRESDAVGRVGGDEFVVVATGDDKGLKTIKERIQAAVKKWVQTGEPKAHLGVSIGCAAWKRGMSPDALFQAADIAMYREKKEHTADSYGVERHFAKPVEPV